MHTPEPRTLAEDLISPAMINECLEMPREGDSALRNQLLTRKGILGLVPNEIPCPDGISIDFFDLLLKKRKIELAAALLAYRKSLPCSMKLYFETVDAYISAILGWALLVEAQCTHDDE